jgi:diaminopimelate epimerase
MDFIKMHGTGNDFVMLDADADDRDWSALAIAMCDRHFGVGSDGIIVALPSAASDLRMRMFNPDGSEAEMCGNGIRCLAKHAVEAGLARTRDGAITIETLAGDLRCELQEHDGAIVRVRVAMGHPRFQPAEIPVLANGAGPLQDFAVEVDAQTFPVTCVSMGNPHAVCFTEIPVAAFSLAQIGPRIEHHPAFPRRVNFEIVNVVERGRVRARVWERGAGETLACGTGACAIGVAARLAGFSDRSTEVNLPGGALLIEWDGAGEVYLSGPATEVFRGEWLPAGRPAAVGSAS